MDSGERESATGGQRVEEKGAGKGGRGEGARQREAGGTGGEARQKSLKISRYTLWMVSYDTVPSFGP